MFFTLKPDGDVSPAMFVTLGPECDVSTAKLFTLRPECDVSSIEYVTLGLDPRVLFYFAYFLESETIIPAALCPGAPVTPPPGWVPEPQM